MTTDQPFTIPTPGMPAHRALYKKRERRSRGGEHSVPDVPNLISSGVASGLQALVSQAGGTMITHLGTATAAPRLVIPLPAALATATAISTGNVVPTPVVGAKGTPASPDAPLPSMLIDSEWFYPQAYPVELRQYLATSYSFDLRPTSPLDTIEKTQVFLRDAYRHLKDLDLNVKIAGGLKEMFDNLVATDPATYRPLYPYGQSESVNNGYMIMAYVLTTLLWINGATKPLRTYPEATYPGVIAASYVVRLQGFYNDVSKSMGLNTPTSLQPYLRAGGREAITDTTSLLGQNFGREDNAGIFAFSNIPAIATDLKIAAQYLTGRKTDTKACSPETYAALQDAALNIPDLPVDVVNTAIMLKRPKKTDPLASQITDARCAYYLGLLTKKINPADLTKAVPGGDPGLEPL